MASAIRGQMVALTRPVVPRAQQCLCSGPGRLPVRRFLATVVDIKQQDAAEPAQSTSSETSPVMVQAEKVKKPKTRKMRPPGPRPAGPLPPPVQKPRIMSPTGDDARRTPNIVPESQAHLAQQIYLPNIVFRLVRNSPAEQRNPYIATFRVPVQLTKPDIVSYLWQIYGLKVTSISTVVEMGDKIIRTPGTYKAVRRKKSTKKAIVGMEEPFWFPEARSEKWLDDYFEKSSRADQLRSRLLPIGDGGPGRGRRSNRWRGASVTKHGIGARHSQIVQRLRERRALQEEQVKRLVAQEVSEMTEKVQGLKTS